MKDDGHSAWMPRHTRRVAPRPRGTTSATVSRCVIEGERGLPHMEVRMCSGYDHPVNILPGAKGASPRGNYL
eukprot:1045817-Prymnesium_polylepis.2